MGMLEGGGRRPEEAGGGEGGRRGKKGEGREKGGRRSEESGTLQKDVIKDNFLEHTCLTNDV
jgi:hypothetical protein